MAPQELTSVAESAGTDHPTQRDQQVLSHSSRWFQPGFLATLAASQLPFHQPGCLVRCRVTSDLAQITVWCLPLSDRVTQRQDDVQWVHVSFIRIVYLLSLWIRTIYFKLFPEKSTGLSFSERSEELSGTPKCVYSNLHPLSQHGQLCYFKIPSGT